MQHRLIEYKYVNTGHVKEHYIHHSLLVICARLTQVNVLVMGEMLLIALFWWPTSVPFAYNKNTSLLWGTQRPLSYEAHKYLSHMRYTKTSFLWHTQRPLSYEVHKVLFSMRYTKTSFLWHTRTPVYYEV